MATDSYFQQTLPNPPHTFRMVQVAGGLFRMGSPDDALDAFKEEMPQHAVSLDRYWIAEYPVTQALWEAVMGNNPAHFKGEQRPVECVSWLDAVVFCNALSRMVGRNPAYLTPLGEPYGLEGAQWSLPNEGTVHFDPLANGYRLPTEAEWELAAKGGHENLYHYAGSDLLDQVGWYTSNSGGETQEVGLLLPNALGLYDMSGNVWEWCEDWFAAYAPDAQENPRGPGTGVSRVIRGGSWGYPPRDCRPAYRVNIGPDGRGGGLGFRLVLQSVG